MAVEYILTEAHHRPILRQLWQFYMYEFPFMGWKVQLENARFYDYGLDGCWENPQRDTYLLKLENTWAGFAIIDQRDHSHYTDDPRPCIEMTQFFIMAAFQNKGIGKQAAHYFFNRYLGRWEVFELNKNLRAQAFWRKVIADYTQGRYQEIVYEEDDGVVQLFDNSPG